MKSKISLMGILCLINKLLNNPKIIITAILIIYFSCLYIGVSAQQTPAPQKLTIIGSVVSASDDQVLAGATIKIKTTNQIAITNEKGEFSLSSNRGEGTLEVSFLGYLSQEVPFNYTSKYLSIQLDRDENLLSDVDVVVSTGYQNIPKERATGSFVHIDNELLNRSVSTDIISRLKGIAPSLLFDERAGGEPKLSIRGRSTIFANADPLIVVDNFPYEGDIKNINPNDVEDISILRDAAAASIWGVRAGNGVIVITTKKGKKNQPLKISVNSSVTVGAKPDLWYQQSISSTDLIDVQSFLYKYKFYDNKLADTYSYPVIPLPVEILANSKLSDAEIRTQLNNLKGNDIRRDFNNYFFQQKVSQQYGFSVQGGGEKHQYVLNTSFDKDIASQKGNDYSRFALSSQQSFSPVRNLELHSGIFYTYSKRNINAVFQEVEYTAPYFSLKGDDGSHLAIHKDYRQGFAESAVDKGLLNWQYFPLDEFNLSDHNTKLHNIRLNQSVNYRLFKGFNLTALYQFEKQFSNQSNIKSGQSYFTRNFINNFSVIEPNGSITYNFPKGDYFQLGVSEMNAHSGRAQFNYKYENDNHDLSLIGGMEVRQNQTSGNSRILYGYDPNTGLGKAVNQDSLYMQYPLGYPGKIPVQTNLGYTVDRFRSWYTNGSYTFQNKYTLSVSARIDQSNFFGVKANQRSIPLWSVGTKWDISKEPFFQAQGLPLLQLRFTYGFNGNLDNRATAYTTAQYVSDYTTGLNYAYIKGLPNPELRFEKIAMMNLGLDFSSKKHNVSGSLEIYQKKGKDMLGYGPLEPTVGKTSYYGNLADMKGNGIDLDLNIGSFGSNLRFSNAFFVSYNTDEITNYEKKATSISSYFSDLSLIGGAAMPIVGRPLFSVYSYPWAGLDNVTGDPMGYLNNVPSSDYSAIGKAYSLDSLTFHGRATPSWNAAFRPALSLKNWTLSVNITGKFGYYFRRESLQYSQLFNYGIGHTDFTNRWMKAGDENHTNVPSMIYPFSSTRDNFYTNSSTLVEKGDHIRMQDMRLNYVFNDKAANNYHFRNISVFLNLNNPFFLWRANRHKIDPEVANGVLPQPFSCSVGIVTNF